MGIKGLEEYLIAKGLIVTEPLSSLADKRIGIDANHWLRSLPCQEHLQVATGGVPITLKQTVAFESDQFRSNKVSPLFVFGGISTTISERPRSSDPRATKRDHAWDLLQNGDFEGAKAAFQASSASDRSLASYFAPQAMRYLMEGGEQTFVAPMSPWPQLVHFLDPEKSTPPYPIIHAVYGPTELLLYGIRMVILSIDWKEKTFKYVEYSSILGETGLKPEKFFEACILAGFDGCQPTTLPDSLASASTQAASVSSQGTSTSSSLPPGLSPSFSSNHHYFQSYIDSRMGNIDILTIIGPEDSKLNQSFRRHEALLRLYLILDLKGDTRPFTREMVNQLNLVKRLPGFDPMIPEGIWWLLSQGVISTQVLNTMFSSVIIENTPLADSPSYRTLLNELVEVRAKTLALLGALLPTAIGTKPIVTWRWFAPDQNTPIPHTNYKTFVASAAAKWFLPEEAILKDMILRKGLDMQGFDPATLQYQPMYKSSPSIQALVNKNIDLSSAIDLFTTVKIVIPTPPTSYSAIEMQYSVLALTLETAMFMVGKNANDFGKALKLSSPAFSAELFVFIELLRKAHVHGRSICATIPAESFDSQVGIISRVFSMIPMTLNEPWNGPLDRDLAAWNSMVRAVYKTARNLTEMALLNITIASATNPNSGHMIPPPEYQALSARLPFAQESNTAMGIVVASLLKDEKSKFESNFKTLPNLKNDLLKGLAFWKEVLAVVTFFFNAKTVKSGVEVVSKDLMELFTKCNERITAAMEQLP